MGPSGWGAGIATWKTWCRARRDAVSPLLNGNLRVTEAFPPRQARSERIRRLGTLLCVVFDPGNVPLAAASVLRCKLHLCLKSNRIPGYRGGMNALISYV